MKNVRHVAVIVGSLRKRCSNRRIANLLAELAPASLRLEIVEINRLALYKPDLDGNPPPEWKVFRQQIRAADAVLFMTPDCDRAVPGVLRNALDIASHPDGNSAWEGKPGGIVSVSPGSSDGGFKAFRHLRQALACLDVPVMQHPEACIHDATMLFDAGGKLVNPETRTMLQNFIGNFGRWVQTNYLH